MKKLLSLIYSENGQGIILMVWLFGVPGLLAPLLDDVLGLENMFLQIIAALVFVYFYIYGFHRLDKFMTTYERKLREKYYEDLENRRKKGEVFEASRVSKLANRFSKHNLVRDFDSLTSGYPRIYKIIRWILFIPVGLLAGSIAWLVTYFMGGAMNQPEAIGTYIFAIWGGGLSGGISCWVVCFVAPNYKAIVGIVSTVIMTAYLLTGTFYTLEDNIIHHFSTIAYLLGYGYVGIQLFRSKMDAGREV